MSGAIGVICNRDGFGCTHIDGETVTDHVIAVPKSIVDRGEKLSWILEEAMRLFSECSPTKICLLKAAGAFTTSHERNEVEGAIKIAAVRTSRMWTTLTRDQIRAALGVAKGSNAYDGLLLRPEVKARSNKGRREQYLLAEAGLV